MAGNDSKILIFGGTGYIGSYLVKASIKLAHPTYVYSRPNSTKTEVLNEFQSLGVKLVHDFRQKIFIQIPVLILKIMH